MEQQLIYSANTLYWIIFIGIAVASWIVSASLERKFKKYSRVPLALTGKEVAEKMLRDNGITDVQVTCTKGHLTDHYNPAEKTVNLSESVYNSASVAAAAVAAHECGHAIQHDVAYAPLKMRTALVPVVSFAGKWMMWVLLAGMLLIHVAPGIMGFGVAMFALTTLFSFITLPVEIDASRRAVAWLDGAGITSAETTPLAKSALRSAAYTYVVAALGSLANLLYYILILMGSRRD
ncbi:MAG: zinc metallopeptidase [Paludibacteraceae bacterium]|nr:zinc metallopeptidase [Paludibacteraceae bacterium]